MTAEKKIAQKKFTLLQGAERIRKVSEACSGQSISRSQFYEYKRAVQERGFDGFPKSFPNETPPEIKERIINHSIQHPARGPMRDSR